MELIIKGAGSVFDHILWTAFDRLCPACAALFPSRTRQLHTDRGDVFSSGSLFHRFHGYKSYRRYVPIRHGLWRYDKMYHNGPSIRKCCNRRRTILHHRTGIKKTRNIKMTVKLRRHKGLIIRALMALLALLGWLYRKLHPTIHLNREHPNIA